jgi:hypothetical protein
MPEESAIERIIRANGGRRHRETITVGDRIVKIPNAYTRMHPVDRNLSASKPDERPAHLTLTTTIKYILRNGDTGQTLARRMWWGDRSNGEDGAIVAYKVIKLEKAWIDWGHRFDRGEELGVAVGSLPAGLDPTVRVKVWLRNYPAPQADIRPASHWDWVVSGENGGDIMKYRIMN